MQIHQNDISDLLRVMPDLKPFDPQISYDLLICALGFEDRTHRILDLIKGEGDLKRTTLVLIKYPTNEKDNNLNASHFETIQERLRGFQEIKYSYSYYSMALSNILREQLKNEGLRVCFDISTCSSYLFYPTMKELLEYEIDLTITYTNRKYIILFTRIGSEWQNKPRQNKNVSSTRNHLKKQNSKVQV